MMNLILWRHAEAEDYATSDLARQLTVRGRKDAQAMAKWLRGRLETNAVILASPAARTVQTVEALTDQYRTVDVLAPGGSVDDVLAATGWPASFSSTPWSEARAIISVPPAQREPSGMAQRRSRMVTPPRRAALVERRASTSSGIGPLGASPVDGSPSRTPRVS